MKMFGNSGVGISLRIEIAGANGGSRENQFFLCVR